MKNSDSFMDWVQLHERAWGNDSYVGRPKLQDIMSAPIITVWRTADKKEKRYKIKLHQELKEIEDYYSKILFRMNIQPNDDKLARIYVNKERYTITGVKFMFRPVDYT